MNDRKLATNWSLAIITTNRNEFHTRNLNLERQHDKGMFTFQAVASGNNNPNADFLLDFDEKNAQKIYDDDQKEKNRNQSIARRSLSVFAGNKREGSNALLCLYPTKSEYKGTNFEFLGWGVAFSSDVIIF